MTATRKPYVSTPDNGYFQLWTRPCGHTVRVTTESEGWSRRQASERRRLDNLTRDRLATTPCRKCAELAAWVAS